MPYIGKWGTFIHIPKTGGCFVRQVLGQIGPFHKCDRKTHDLPVDWNNGDIWTSVRDPAEWLASVWAHQERNVWRLYPHQVPWQYLLDILASTRNDNWDEWILTITGKFPGIVGWFYNVHSPQVVKTYRLGPDLYRKLWDIGGNPDLIAEPVNAGDNLPEISNEQRIMVYNAERTCYKRYGFENLI